MVQTSRLEGYVKEKLARELANKLIDAVEFEERLDYRTMTKEITASLTMMDENTLGKFNNAMKLFKEVI
jgi:hypothetical protein